jgi:anthraniloyl-CoA monooxygenase
MAQYSAREGNPTDRHLVHYGSRAIGGAGLIYTEMTCPAPEARITPGCTGIWNAEQCAQWHRIADFVHANSAAKFCLQFGHAGRKGSTRVGWEGMDLPLENDNWSIYSASALPYRQESAMPIALKPPSHEIKEN